MTCWKFSLIKKTIFEDRCRVKYLLNLKKNDECCFLSIVEETRQRNSEMFKIVKYLIN